MEFEGEDSSWYPKIKTEYSITALLGNLDDISIVYMSYNHPFLVGQPSLPELNTNTIKEEVLF